MDEFALEEFDLLEFERFVRLGERLVSLRVRPRKEFAFVSIRLLKNSGG